MSDNRANNHTCSCANCSAALRAVLPAGTANFGIQFPGHVVNLRVLKGDEDISNSVWQVIAGHEGTAWRFSEPHHLCLGCLEWQPFKARVCAYLDHAEFVVAGELLS